VSAAFFTFAVETSVNAAPLSWSAPDSCPKEDEMRARVASVVGDAKAETLDANVTVRRDGERFTAQLRVGEGGERVIDESTCGVLAEAVVAVLALGVGDGTTEPLAPAPPPAQAPPNVEHARVVDTASPSPSTSVPRFGVGLFALADHGTLPSTALQGGIEAAYDPIQPLRLQASLALSDEQSASVGGQSVGGRFRLVSVDTRACWSPLEGDVGAGPCGGVEIAHVDAQGYGSQTTSTRNVTWWAPTAGAFLRWNATRFLGFALLGDLAIPAVRRTFLIEGTGVVHRPASIAVRGAIATEVRF
jgi:hypothetical protein